MARFRLRYQSTDLEMPVGQFVVGRSSSCHLALDDALVSRRHAIFHVTEELVEVEDLGSRNGVQVNGSNVVGRRELAHLDRVVIGSQDLLLVRSASSVRERNDRPTLAGLTLDLPVMRPNEFVDEPTEALRSESVLDRIADKALALGRFDEAERMLGRRLDALYKDIQSGQKLAPEKLHAAISYAMRLASGTGKSRWVDWVFKALEAAGELPDAETIAQLNDVVRQIRYPGSAALTAYLGSLRSRADSMGPNQRFLLQRLEGIARMVGA